MADWSKLPRELVVLVANRLEPRVDVLRFRSVCSSWRSSVAPKLYPYPLPRYLPSRIQGSCRFYLSNITRHTFCLIRLAGTGTGTGTSHCNQTEAPSCWLVKIIDGTQRVKMRLRNPLSDSELGPLPENFPKVLDLTDFQIIELGHEYIGQNNMSLEYVYRDYRDKVVFLRPSTDSDDFIMLALSPHPAFFRSSEKEWIVLENLRSAQDIISFNEKFYAIDGEGRTIVIDRSLNVSFLEHVFSSGSRLFLVESVDDLLAVEMLSNPDAVGDKVDGFRVFRMHEEEHKWDEMESLRDRILFLGFHQAISAPASEFCWGKGNLIFYLGYYPHGLRKSPHYCNPKNRHMFVFDLETGTASPLENFPAYCNLFWPPPKWVTSSESAFSSTQVISNSTHSTISATPETEYKCPQSGQPFLQQQISREE